MFWYKLEQPAIPTNPSELSEARRARRFIIESCLIEEKYFSQSERLVVDRNTCTQGLTARTCAGVTVLTALRSTDAASAWANNCVNGGRTKWLFAELQFVLFFYVESFQRILGISTGVILLLWTVYATSGTAGYTANETE